MVKQRAHNLPPPLMDPFTAQEHPRRRPSSPSHSPPVSPLITPAQVEETLADLFARFALSDLPPLPSYHPPARDGAVIGDDQPGVSCSACFDAYHGFASTSISYDAGPGDPWRSQFSLGSNYGRWDRQFLDSIPNGVYGNSPIDLGLIPDETNIPSITLPAQRFLRGSVLNDRPLNALRGHIMSLSLDRYGCRFLQAKFRHISVEEIDMVFRETIEYLGVLMVDTYGNYIFQKLVEVCSELQRSQILMEIVRFRYRLFAICCNTHGTRSMQKLLVHLKTKSEVDLALFALSRDSVQLSMDDNGHHVIKHCLQRFPQESNRLILREIAYNCVEVAKDKSGCCVVQLCMKSSLAEFKSHIVAEITTNSLILAEHCYGNYVVQYVLDIQGAPSGIIGQFRGNFFPLSCNKFASNVVQKCLKVSSNDQRGQIIMELINNPRFSLMLVDPFGNYVVQTALSVAEGSIERVLRERVQKHSTCMRSDLYGKNILTRLDRKKHRA